MKSHIFVIAFGMDLKICTHTHTYMRIQVAKQIHRVITGVIEMHSEVNHRICNNNNIHKHTANIFKTSFKPDA